MKTLIFGGGCFWCTEAIFKYVSGVEDVVPGYIGGTTQNPTYEEVCSGKTGHAEAVKISYDETKNFSEIASISSLSLNSEGILSGSGWLSCAAT